MTTTTKEKRQPPGTSRFGPLYAQLGGAFVGRAPRRRFRYHRWLWERGGRRGQPSPSRKEMLGAGLDSLLERQDRWSVVRAGTLHRCQSPSRPRKGILTSAQPLCAAPCGARRQSRGRIVGLSSHRKVEGSRINPARTPPRPPWFYTRNILRFCAPDLKEALPPPPATSSNLPTEAKARRDASTVPPCWRRTTNPQRFRGSFSWALQSLTGRSHSVLYTSSASALLWWPTPSVAASGLTRGRSSPSAARPTCTSTNFRAVPIRAVMCAEY